MSSRDSTRLALALLVVAAMLLVPSLVFACPVCGTPKNEESRMAFVSMTGFMTLLPLALIGIGVAWFVSRVRQLEAADERRKRSKPASDDKAAAAHQ